MSQTNLPNKRRLGLFLLILVLFAVTVFGTRYLLVALGWVGGETDSSTTQKQPPQIQQSTTSSLTSAEVQQAKSLAESFIQRYTERDLRKSTAWFQSIQEDLHPTLAEEIQSEVENARPTVLVQATQFQTLQRSTCHPLEEKVQCHLSVGIKTIDKQQQTTQSDKVYELILSRVNGKWKVEGLNIHGSID